MTSDAAGFGWILGAGREVFRFVAELSRLAESSLRLILRRRIDWKLTVDQMAHLAVESLPLVAMTVALSGMVLALYSVPQFKQFGATQFLGGLIAAAMTQEMAPVLTAIVVAARVGSAIAAEIGTMKVTEQVDALRAMATDPVEYLVVPRLLAGMVGLPLLTTFADLFGIGGGWFVARAGGISDLIYVDSVRRFLKMEYLAEGWAKALVFGLIITLTSCHQGFRAEGSAEEVGRVTTRSVVLCVFLVYLMDYVLALFMA